MLPFSFSQFTAWATLFCFAGFIAVLSVEPELTETEKIPPDDSDIKQPTSAPPTMSHKYLLLLAETDALIYESLRKFLNAVNVEAESNRDLRLHILRFVEDYETSVGRLVMRGTSTEDASRIYKNPLLIFRMIFRFAVDLEAIAGELLENPDDDAKTLLETLQRNLEDGEVWADTKVLDEAMERLVVLMFVYDFEVSDVASGVLQNISTGLSLATRHCVLIGQYASRSGYHALAIEWIRHAQKLGTDASEQTQEEMTLLLQRAISKHNAEFDIGKAFPPYTFFMEKIDVAHLRPLARQRTYHGKGDTNEGDKLKLKYYAICGGRDYQSEKTKSELHCWHDTRLHPAFQINPLKVELLSRAPRLVQFHDFVSRGEAEELMDLAEPRLTPSSLSPPGINNITTHGPWRTPFLARNEQFLDCPACRRLSRRAYQITKLDTFANSIVSYSYGTLGNLHSDARPRDVGQYDFRIVGDRRVATLLVYLTDVEAGGRTAFPLIGVGVNPQAGSGLLWYNFDENIIRDDKMIHGACPLILGGPKWVDNMVKSVQGQKLG